MDAIKLATPEQVEEIKKVSDLTPSSVVVAFGNDLAVIRQVTEVDPVFFNEFSDVKRRMLFIWGIENMLRFNGVPEYYFNIHANQPEWKEYVEKWGAISTSTTPEFRFKKTL